MAETHGYVRFWIEHGTELAMLTASDFRSAMTERDRLRAENERLRMALTRLVELGEDDGSAPDDAWKTAFEQAANLLGRAKK